MREKGSWVKTLQSPNREARSTAREGWAGAEPRSPELGPEASSRLPAHAPTWDHRARALSPRERAGKTAAGPEGGRASREDDPPGTYAAASS